MEHSDHFSICGYWLSGILVADWLIPFLHGMNEFAPAIGAILAILTFILSLFRKKKAS